MVRRLTRYRKFIYRNGILSLMTLIEYQTEGNPKKNSSDYNRYK